MDFSERKTRRDSQGLELGFDSVQLEPQLLGPPPPRRSPSGRRDIFLENHSSDQVFVTRRKSQDVRGSGSNQAKITSKELDILLDRETNLRRANEAIASENSALKSAYQATDGQLRQLQHQIPQLEHQVRSLSHENQYLRRSLDTSDGVEADVARLRAKNSRLRTDNENLSSRLRAVERDIRDRWEGQVAQLTGEMDTWRRRYLDKEDDARRTETEASRLLGRLQEKSDQLRVVIQDRDELESREARHLEKMVTYENILRRHRLLRASGPALDVNDANASQASELIQDKKTTKNAELETRETLKWKQQLREQESNSRRLEAQLQELQGKAAKLDEANEQYKQQIAKGASDHASLKTENEALREALREALTHSLRDALRDTFSEYEGYDLKSDIKSVETLKKQLGEVLQSGPH